jgi:putative ABC transport system substrate-binding protein
MGVTRRAVTLGLLTAVVVPSGGAAQGRAHVARIGRLSPLSAETDAPNLEGFRRGLRDLGWIEGQHFTIDARFVDGRSERLRGLAEELVRQRVDLMLIGSTQGVLAGKEATTTIPIVMVTTGDPVEGKLVASLARPGGNVTGVTALSQVLNAKRLELIKEAVTGVARVAVLTNPSSPYTAPFLREREAIARALGLHITVLEATEPRHLDKTIAMLHAERAGAVLVLTDAMFITQRRRIVDLIAKTRVPAVYGEREFVEAGGLMFYGASLADMYRDAAGYAVKILKGARPADLPIEQPTKLELVINLKTARALRVTIPQSVLLRSDHVIQ